MLADFSTNLQYKISQDSIQCEQNFSNKLAERGAEWNDENSCVKVTVVYCENHTKNLNTLWEKFIPLILQYSRTRLKRHRFMGHLVYSIRYSVVPINYSLLTTTL
jgi:hypothetical protein